MGTTKKEKKTLSQKIGVLVDKILSKLDKNAPVIDEDIEDKEYKFKEKTVAPWLKQTIKVDGAYIIVTKPNTMFGIIPSGKQEKRLNRYLIRQLSMNTDVNGTELFLSIIIYMAVTSMFKRYGFNVESIITGIIAYLLGLTLFIDSFKTQLDIGGGSKGYYSISVPITERKQLMELYPKMQLKTDGYNKKKKKIRKKYK